MDGGRIIALDTPENLVRDLGVEERVSFVLERETAGTFSQSLVVGVPGVTRVEAHEDDVSVYGTGEALVSEIVSALARAGIRFTDLKPERLPIVAGYRKRGMSGAGIPREPLPPWMRTVAQVFPMTHAVTLLKGLWLGGRWIAYVKEGAILVAVLGVCAGASSRLFRWE